MRVWVYSINLSEKLKKNKNKTMFNNFYNSDSLFPCYMPKSCFGSAMLQ